MGTKSVRVNLKNAGLVYTVSFLLCPRRGPQRNDTQNRDLCTRLGLRVPFPSERDRRSWVDVCFWNRSRKYPR